MKFLALEISLPNIQPARFTPELKQAEARRVYELQQADILREIYFRADQPLAVLVLECPSQVEALQALNSLPLVQAHLIDFDLIPLSPYPGLSRLFQSDNTSKLSTSSAN
jgi:muconolactone delta-isomerase